MTREAVRLAWATRVDNMTAADDVRIPEGDAVSSAVLFDRVSFAFDDHIVLRDISFSVPTGRSGLVRSESTHL